MELDKQGHAVTVIIIFSKYIICHLQCKYDLLTVTYLSK